jgi:ABC-2 type transport system ATP-binding protein
MSAVAQWRAASKRFGDIVALDALDLAIEAGEVLAVLGPNGAGKTTAINLLLGLIAPDAGSVTLHGSDPRNAAAREGVGAVLQTAGLPGKLSIAEVVGLFARYHAKPRTMASVLDQVGLGALAARRLDSLSGGERRRVEFAIALVGTPRLLVLDEPTVGVDTRERHALIENIAALRASGCAVLLTTHLLEEAERLATRVALLVGGRLRAVGDVATVKAMARGNTGRIRITSDSPPEQLQSLPGVSSVAVNGAQNVIESSACDTTLRALLAHDASARDIEVIRGSLESAYLELTAGSQA